MDDTTQPKVRVYYVLLSQAYIICNPQINRAYPIVVFCHLPQSFGTCLIWRHFTRALRLKAFAIKSWFHCLDCVLMKEETDENFGIVLASVIVERITTRVGFSVIFTLEARFDAVQYFGCIPLAFHQALALHRTLPIFPCLRSQQRLPPPLSLSPACQLILIQRLVVSMGTKRWGQVSKRATVLQRKPLHHHRKVIICLMIVPLLCQLQRSQCGDTDESKKKDDNAAEWFVLERIGASR